MLINKFCKKFMKRVLAAIKSLCRACKSRSNNNNKEKIIILILLIIIILVINKHRLNKNKIKKKD